MEKRALDRVIGYDSIKQELFRIIDSLKCPEKYEKLGADMLRGIIFSGSPGIGKTLMAEAVIEEIGWNAISLKKSTAEEKFHEDVVKAFDDAKSSAPSVLYMDDIDKYGKGKNGDEIYTTIQTCIDECANKKVFIIATANLLSSLPLSLYREGRFDKRFELEPPGGNDAKEIFYHYLKKTNTLGDIDAEEIARCLDGYSCAALECLVKEAAVFAGYSSKEKIDQDDLRTACLRLFFGAPELLEYISDEEKKKIAIHEAGHALIAELLMPGCVNFVSIKAMDSDVMGLTSLRKKSRHGELKDFKRIEHEIMIDLGGKAATELLSGEIDTGANKDMHSAFNKARAIFDAYTGYDFNSWSHGEETAQTVYNNLDVSTQSAVARYYADAKRLLTKNREVLKELSDTLLEKETLFYKEIEEICLKR